MSEKYGFERDLAFFWKNRKKQHAGNNTETILNKQRRLAATRDQSTNFTPANFSTTDIKVLNPTVDRLLLIQNAPLLIDVNTTFTHPLSVQFLDENDNPKVGETINAIPTVGSGANLTAVTDSQGIAVFTNLTLDTVTSGQIVILAFDNHIRVSTRLFKVNP